MGVNFFTLLGGGKVSGPVEDQLVALSHGKVVWDNDVDAGAGGITAIAGGVSKSLSLMGKTRPVGEAEGL